MIKCISITVLCICLCGCATHMLTSSHTANADTSGEFAGTNKIITAQHGIASWYNIKTNYGTQTASGRPLHNDALTAAHKEWPMGSKVKVTNCIDVRPRTSTGWSLEAFSGTSSAGR